MSTIIDQTIMNALGWTLIHSLWQGAMLAILAALLMYLMRKMSARARYLLLSLLLLSLPITSVVTFLNIYNMPAQETAVVVASDENLVEAMLKIPVTQEESLGSWISGFAESARMEIEDHLFLVSLFWLVGALFFLLRMTGSLLYTSRIRHYGTIPVPRAWETKVAGLAGKLNIRSQVRIVESWIIRVPVVIGWFRPVILVPAGMIAGMPTDQMEAILLHELAHIRRMDYLVNILQSIIEALYFYHPVAWWISSLIREEREHVCDDVALAHIPDRLVYARALSAVEELNVRVPATVPALFRKRSQLFNRISRVMKLHQRKHSNLGSKMSALILLTTLLVVTAGAAIRLDDQESILSQPAEAGLTLVPVAELLSNPGLIETPADEESATTDPERIPEYLMPVEVPADPDSVKKADEERQKAEHERQQAIESYQKAKQEERKAYQEMRESLKRDRDAARAEWHLQWAEPLHELEEFYFSDSSGKLLWHFEMPEMDLYHEFDMDAYQDAMEEYRIHMDTIHDYIRDIMADSAYQEAMKGYQEMHQDQWAEHSFKLQQEMQRLKEKEWDLKELENWNQKNYRFFDGENLKHHEYVWPEPSWKPSPPAGIYGLGDIYFGSKTESIIRQEMIKDNLIDRKGDYIIELNNKNLIINGEIQSRDKYKKYKRLYESMEEIELGPDHKFKLII